MDQNEKDGKEQRFPSIEAAKSYAEAELRRVLTEAIERLS